MQGSVRRYRALVADLLGTGVLLDEAMAYFDARLSARYPTVEVRVADVCLRAEDAVLIAALCRGLVETAARDARAGKAAPAVPAALLRLAAWRAARSGTADVLVRPADWRPRPAHEVIADLVDHVRPALTSPATSSGSSPCSSRCWPVAAVHGASARCWTARAGCGTSCWTLSS